MTPEVKLVIPTYRLKDVAETVRAYRQNFTLHGHDNPIIIFDDSLLDIARRDLPLLKKCHSDNLFYVGPEEKAAFISELLKTVGACADSRNR